MTAVDPGRAHPLAVAPPSPRRSPWIVAGIALALVALAVALVDGYAFGREWTGVDRETHLWDVLKLLVLPLVLGAVPVWIRTHRSRSRAWHVALTVGLASFAALFVGGYLLGWEWTGFQGNELWDWLELLVLPIVLGSLPRLLERDPSFTGPWRMALGVAAIAFVIVVIGGYGLGWDWTGFQGNTLWDWLGLFLVPFALPAAIVWYRVSHRRVDAAPA